MPITRNLVRMMHGEIFVKSIPGLGSVFTVRLPQKNLGNGVVGREMAENLRLFRLDPGMQQKKAHIVQEPMPYGSVLLVDDVDTNLYVAKGLMQQYKLHIDTARSGFEAVAKIKSGNSYDVVFMDHMMPRMSGMEATRIIRGLGYERPIVALTANAVVGQADMFLANGFDGFISKPIDLRLLNAMLNKLIRDKQTPETIEAARRQYASIHDTKTPETAEAARPDRDRRMAKAFLRDAGKALAVLEKAYDTEEMDGGKSADTYALNAHSMKSALANIGEAELSAFAARLEEAGRQRDIAVIAAQTPDFVNALRAVMQKITPKEQ
jgi:CheY-like chemotaxis protein/HPt (histidine-containing phosphotransfer) domain-containing protein